MNLPTETELRELHLQKYGAPATEAYARDHLEYIEAHPEAEHLAFYTSPFVEKIAALMAAERRQRSH